MSSCLQKKKKNYYDDDDDSYNDDDDDAISISARSVDVSLKNMNQDRREYKIKYI